MFTTTARVYGTAVDGRRVLVYPAGAQISDDEARRLGLLEATRTPVATEKPADDLDYPSMTKDALREILEARGVDVPGKANKAALLEFLEVEG